MVSSILEEQHIARIWIAMLGWTVDVTMQIVVGAIASRAVGGRASVKPHGFILKHLLGCQFNEINRRPPDELSRIEFSLKRVEPLP